MAAAKLTSLSTAVTIDGSSELLRLAKEQGLPPVTRFEDLLGGWPREERNDGFESTLAEWRRQQVYPRP